MVLGNNSIFTPDGNGYIFDMQAAVVIESSKGLIDYSIDPLPVPGDKFKDKSFVPWGEENDLPQQVIEKVKASEVLGAGLNFNISVGFGDSVLPVRRLLVNNKFVWEPALDIQEINSFFEENDINSYLLEQLTDLNFFHNVFPEIILNRKRDRIVELNHKEATFSRWGEMNSKGIIEDHYYCGKWDDNPSAEDIEHTPVLNYLRPTRDLLERIGREKDRFGKSRTDNHFRYIMPVRMPSPGSNYYSWPYWHSVFESGWYDFAASIPQFKKAKITNEMSIKYVIYLAEDYFPKIYAEENITGEAEMKERKTAEFNNIRDFLSGSDKAGKSMISYVKYSPDGKELRRVRIEVLNAKKEGGEYIEDSEEASNIMSYAMGVHPSIIGSTPGKNKGSFSGTDKRELFIIKQSMMKPIRDILLKPLYLVKTINRWPEDVFFTIPNIALTTLDEGKQKEKVIATNDLNE
jgi:hypothetical protein